MSSFSPHRSTFSRNNMLHFSFSLSGWLTEGRTILLKMMVFMKETTTSWAIKVWEL
jgi:hypothetical protein